MKILSLLFVAIPLLLVQSTFAQNSSVKAASLRSADGVEIEISYDSETRKAWGTGELTEHYAANLEVVVPAASVGSKTTRFESRIRVTESVIALCPMNYAPSEPKTFALNLSYDPTRDAYVGDFAQYAYFVFPSGVSIPAERVSLSKFRTDARDHCYAVSTVLEIALHDLAKPIWERDPINGTNNFRF